MEPRFSLDDVALFLAIADAGSLAAASRATGVPLPTLSRRMGAFERQSGRRLFTRGGAGYRLTAEGRKLADAAAPVRDAQHCLRSWGEEMKRLPRVRITSGIWTARLIAEALPRIWSPEAGWVPELLAQNATVDIARREADIGVRSVAPDQAWLASRRIGRIRHAIYGVPGAGAGFVSLSEGVPTTPAERWLRQNRPYEIVTMASDARTALDLARSGLGRIVLPCFVGDAEPGFQRLSDPIPELTHEEWIVSHHEARHDPPVRAALDALTSFLAQAKR